MKGRVLTAACAAAVAMLTVNGPAVPVTASHGAFNQSVGVYRIPYGDGNDVEIFQDHHTHAPVNRIDMGVGTGTPVVASASGIIRAIVDFNGTAPEAGDGVDINGNPQVDLLEHSCQDDDLVVGSGADYNNYVWIEHSNGEWSKCTHFGTAIVNAVSSVFSENVNAATAADADAGPMRSCSRWSSSSRRCARHTERVSRKRVTKRPARRGPSRGGLKASAYLVLGQTRARVNPAAVPGDRPAAA
jgi:hypothetical protein